MNAQQIRQTFLDFFAGRDHKIVKSSSLQPKDDPTILFTNAGMNQFKNIFLGLEKRSYKRAASVQKCLRVSGKHNDLEQVGRTAKHHTFFEMLGNFSFGDYFKQEAIALAWELVIDTFRLDKEKIYVTVYKEDEEAFRIWNEEVGVPGERIFGLGKEDNFWAMGETGPCGPCSEIHYDQGSSLEEGEPQALIAQGSDRFLELWNLVFMQYFQDERGELHSLPSPSIDTGMGLERTAAALQHKKSNFDTDLFIPLIELVCEFSKREYPSHDEGDISVRTIADHIRAISFLIGDGIMPANEGRGYVLRRLIRRAFRHGNRLGLEKPFLYKLAGRVADIMKVAYPELLSSANFIARICLNEEERFASTLAAGLRYFHQYVEEARSAGKTRLTGAEAFKLYDTFGFPLDLSQELAAEQKMDIDNDGFERELEEQRERARSSWRGDEKRQERKTYEEMKGFPVRYIGYETSQAADARVLAILIKGARAPEISEGQEGEIVLDRTPFYAEAGGQAGDTGWLRNPHFSAAVENTYFPIPEIIAQEVKVISGRLREGDLVDAEADAVRRKAISINHTATHLLHAALRQVLGDHVKQAGSLVSPARLRFDFTHFAALSQGELARVEQLVNEKIREDAPVSVKVTTLDDGLKEGAMAIFEEKYGERVRMISIADFSKELCGGVHAHSTGEIGFFQIISETSVAAGMRRIEALTGDEALKHIQEAEALLEDIEQTLGVPRKDILSHIEKLRSQLKEKEKENKSLRQKLMSQRSPGGEEKIREVKGIRVITQKVEGLNTTEVRELADALKQKAGSGVVILGAVEGKKAFLVVAVTKNLTSRLNASELIQELAPLVGGGGGGRADFAQAGGGKPEGLDRALESALKIIEKRLDVYPEG